MRITEIILNADNDEQSTMMINDKTVSHRNMLNFIVSNTMIDFGCYYSLLTSCSIFLTLMLNYLIPELKLDVTMIILCAIGLISLYFHPIEKFECDKNGQCKQKSLFGTTNKFKQLKFKYDTSFKKIFQVLIFSIVLSILLTNLIHKTLFKIVDPVKLKNKLGILKI